MTREEYLSALKNNITSLTEDEKAEALQYYSDYFEDANDDEKVMAELGSPEEAAKKIMENFSNALTSTKKPDTDDSANDESTSSFAYDSDKLCYTFDNINAVTLNLGACHTVIIPGNKWIIETRGINSESLECEVKNSRLVINTVKRMNLFNFFSHEHKSRIIPRILITVPCNVNLEDFKIQLGAGLLKTQELSINTKRTVINLGAGNLEMKGLNSEHTELKVGMGNLELTGDLKGRSNIDCGMGAVKLNLKDSEKNYSLDCKVGLGDVRFNNTKYSGVQTIIPDGKKENHLSINCGMGSVICKTK
ncbi:MAG: DUF4097 family beta strand repeat-containing protein [Treponema sp.]|nr:DUF4097 family beta strand repeat-containing protein [Treponema sp.]